MPPSSQDGILFGAVGAYDWDGAVLEESRRGRLVPPREAFEPEFPLELKNHAAYLGTGGGVPGGAPCPRVWDGAGVLLVEAGEPQHPRVAQHPGGGGENREVWHPKVLRAPPVWGDFGGVRALP